MNLGQRLVQANLVKDSDIAQAMERQRRHGGTLGQNLVALGLVRVEDLDRFLNPVRPVLRSINDTGLSQAFLLNLAMKVLYTHTFRTASEVAVEIRLPVNLVATLLKLACDRQLLEAQGSTGADGEVNYVVSRKGREWVDDAFEQSLYVGPAPVSLAAFREQVLSQRITNDRVTAESLHTSLAHLILPESLMKGLGPAVNSGRAILIYGPPGNGKTSVAAALSNGFSHTIYVPHAVEVDGQIIKVFDPEIHRPVEVAAEPVLAVKSSLLRAKINDERWVPCRRPVAICGGELSLEMLELSYSEASRIYEAPIQLKAVGGVLLIDDFGRQKVEPAKLLNRWIVPLEKGCDYLSLRSGRKIDVPFDGLVLFSTNCQPRDIMDDAMLRRIPYKIAVEAPNESQYKQIFKKAAIKVGVDYEEAVLESFFDRHYRSNVLPMACYHPAFLLNYVVSRCRYDGKPSRIDADILEEALTQLLIR
ncbi:AAA family ATPase [uncultured Gammaproteobacteria bacterium]